MVVFRIYQTLAKCHARVAKRTTSTGGAPATLQSLAGRPLHGYHQAHEWEATNELHFYPLISFAFHRREYITSLQSQLLQASRPPYQGCTLHITIIDTPTSIIRSSSDDCSPPHLTDRRRSTQHLCSPRDISLPLFHGAVWQEAHWRQDPRASRDAPSGGTVSVDIWTNASRYCET